MGHTSRTVNINTKFRDKSYYTSLMMKRDDVIAAAESTSQKESAMDFMGDQEQSMVYDGRHNMQLDIQEVDNEESFKSEEDNQASFIQRNMVDCSLRKPLIEE